ncbi:hypothetical protein HU719_023225 [Pseudomonas sp. SWRI107]|uniref:hypothetical protein n=1 Tax=Pseudomonas TaxID=286 RepID=UPI001645C7C8|nr:MULTISPECIES: hypothetical protein [Pseudomonas]MBC3412403.1 hypothetical protein [Pseudomonas sp. SWRI51]MBV4534305.1 hypothetical protein [Pseudomonas farsensis]
MFRHRLVQLCSLLLVVCPLISTAHAQDPKAGASPLSVVQQELGTYQYVSGHSEENAQGYTIESGNLIEPAKGLVEGSVVMVSDKDGAITAIIDRPGRRGTLYINKEGTRHFLEEPPLNWSSFSGHRLRCLGRLQLLGYWRQIIVVAVEPDSVVAHEEVSHVASSFFDL